MKKILFVSYYFAPYDKVASLRNTYWAENIAKVDNDFSVDVITAIERDGYKAKNINKIYQVKNIKKVSLVNCFIKDQGVQWKRNLKRFIRENPNLKYDYVVITGGPFMHFDLVPFFKKKFGCKVILDYRDPFANNPKIHGSKLKNKIKEIHERKFNKSADRIITVNESRKKVLKCDDSKKITVIENGYNELLVDKMHQKKGHPYSGGKINAIYTGRLYQDSHVALKNFCEVIAEDEFNGKWGFQYLGQNQQEVEEILLSDVNIDKSNIYINDNIEYSQMINYLSACDLGLLFTGGTKLESPTKIFDYIGMDMPILIITQGEKEHGNLGRITKKIDMTWWSSSEKDEIRKVLREIMKNKPQCKRTNRSDFSRRAGLEKLIDVVKGC